MNNSVAAMGAVRVVGVKGEGTGRVKTLFHRVMKSTVQLHRDYRVLPSSNLSNGKRELKRIQRKDTRVEDRRPGKLPWNE